MKLPKVLAIILAGGKGSRLESLTDHRAKPALPIAGTYRLIDISLSNLAHSYTTDVIMALQYLPNSINDHIKGGRAWDLDRSYGGLQLAFPFEGKEGEGFSAGNTSTLHSQIQEIEKHDPDLVLVLSADHLYLVNYLDVLDTHQTLEADLTMVTTDINEDPSRYSVVKAEDQIVTDFQYKPEEPISNTVGCEIFLFKTKKLVDALRELAEKDELADYGDDLIPYFVENHRVAQHKHNGYWLDLGTVQSYWAAHMEILAGEGIRLDDEKWPIWSAQPQLLPAKIHESATIDNSLIAPGANVRGEVINSVIGPCVTVEEGATLRNCVVLNNATIPSGASLLNAIVDFDAEVTAHDRGSDKHITLIDSNGQITVRAPFDQGERLPSWARD
ncbi:glucose-1-phosphate adenylyltransferase family protein [Corynebacterium camporealensis]